VAKVFETIESVGARVFGVDIENDNAGGNLSIRCPTGKITIEAMTIEIKGSVLVNIQGTMVKIN